MERSSSGAGELEDDMTGPGVATPTTEHTPINGDISKDSEPQTKLNCIKCCTIL